MQYATFVYAFHAFLGDPLTAKNLPFDPVSLGLYADSDCGKSTSLALLAKYIFKHSGGKIVEGKALNGLRTRVYLTDSGSRKPYEVLEKLGVIEIVDIQDIPFPNITAQEVARGKVYKLTEGTQEAVVGSGKVVISKGTWVEADNSQIGLFVIDGGTALADDMFQWLSTMAGYGINIGGEGAMSFKEGTGTSWGAITIGSSNKAHYGVVQSQMQRFIEALGPMASREQAIVAITFSVDRGEQESMRKSIAGPKLVGGAKTAVVPAWLGLCFNLEKVTTGALTEHVLHMASRDVNGTTWMANRRLPMVEPDHKIYKEMPTSLKPADLPKALLLLKEAGIKVAAEVAKELA